MSSKSLHSLSARLALCVGLAGLACGLTCGSAAAANDEVWAHCRGSEAGVAIRACNEIISRPDAATDPEAAKADRLNASDRNNAYIFRAGAYLDRGQADAAIADYSAAINLAPANAAAYVGRALAYFHKGDRDRAVIDFAIAARLDVQRTSETAAANPNFAQIAALARSSPQEKPDGAAKPDDTANAKTADGNAGAFCPTRETARLGFVLVDHKEQRRQQVDPSPGDVRTVDYFVDGERAIIATYYKGMLIVYGSLLESYITSYDIDYTQQDNVEVGQLSRYHASRMTLDGKVTSATVERRVVGRENLAIGDCKFDTFVVESQTEYPDGETAHTRANFSPALKMNLRFTTTAKDAKAYDVSYDDIEPLSK
jgi:tetratricopeptide (TPR) repeat protein